MWGIIMVSFEMYKSEDIPFDKAEALRYFGYAKSEMPKEVGKVFEECAKEALEAAVYRVCFSEFPIKEHAGLIDLGFTSTNSKSLAKNLCGCEKVTVFAATVGIQIDRLINRYENIYPIKAYAFQAIGTERIESLCSFFASKVAKACVSDGWFTRPRFSCGYGDFPLEKQRDIFTALDCGRKIGLTLNDGMLMSPSKAVTALIGMSRKPSESRTSCEGCDRYSSCDFKSKERR